MTFLRSLVVMLLPATLLFVSCDDGAEKSSATLPPTTVPSLIATVEPPAPGTSTPDPLPSATATTLTPATPGTPASGRDAELIAAAGAGNIDSVRTLLAAGASVHARDGNNATALVAAAYGKHLEIARLLIAHGADVNAKDNTVQSAYLIATSEVGGDARAVELLRLTLENGADVTSLDSYNGTGLIRAADRGFIEIVKLLLTTKINIDHVNRLGWTALLEAVILGRGDAAHTEVVRLLVAAGANVNLADREGKTALSHARQRGYAEIASILQAAGAR